jgi:hypothetical protein
MSFPRAPRPRPLARLLAALAAGLGLVPASDALAKNDNWPPPETATAADVADPKYWPDDPEWAYKTDKDPNKRKAGQWHLYGFQPDRSPGAPPLRADEQGKPSGVSLDLAWRYTIGDPAVLIAVIDSGIKWDEAELINKAYLNARELASHKPHDAQGKDCGGTGDLAGLDCNGDGILSVADYADDPTLTPDPIDDGMQKYPRGDRNHNGVLDAGDLIAAFSDGVDDDGNGYVDDISGWDFMKNDNDPYDDTRYGHGTGEARYSTREANDGRGEAGVCPLCRFVPLRAGDSFIADVQDFSKAVVYATDNGVSVIQEALGTINNSRFTQQALANARQKGLLVVASMADENSKHHNMPATNTWTFPVHVIVNDGANSDPTAAKSFLAYNTCSNYGAQNFMSFPDNTCSSEATGQASGLAGIMYSAARKYNVANFNGGEALQLFTMTADDINVPESQQPNASYFWSQKGFDQRFGYGRANINTAVEWIKAGKIPPVVEITGPVWFENLYKGRDKNVYDITGVISAQRAGSYDYVVEWAPGVQPEEGTYQPLSEMKNVDSKTISGTSGPLAQLDISNITVNNPPDSDGLAGENQYTITVRIRVTAHYGGDIGDVPGEIRRAYQVQEDKDLLPGFPIRIVSSGESSPKLYDVDGDGKRDIILADGGGQVHVFTATNPPAELPGFPFKSKALDGLDGAPVGPSRPNYLDAPSYKTGAITTDLTLESFVATPAVADMDGDGKAEIVATTWQGTIYVINSDGTVKAGWPQRLPDVPSCPTDPSLPRPDVCMTVGAALARGAFAAPVLVDMNKDGKLDVIQAAFDGKVYVYDLAGNQLPGWPVQVHYNGTLVDTHEYNRIIGTPSVADVNGDGIPEVLVGSNEKLSKDAGGYYLIDGRGTLAPSLYLPNWPVTITSINIFPLISEGVPAAPIFGDFDGDGAPDAVFHGNGTSPLIVPVDPGPQTLLGAPPPNNLPNAVDGEGKPRRGLAPSSVFGDLTKARSPDTMLPLFAQPAIGDLDLDGTPDVTTAGGSLSFAGSLASKGAPNAKPGQQLLAMWSGKTGKMMPGSPVPLEDYSFFNSQAIADITGDGFPEVLTGSGGYLVHAVDACGREAPGWPKNTGQWVIPTVAVGDVDGDGTLEAVVASRDGWLYAWHTQGKSDGVIQWEGFHHDGQNTGNYATKLTQGVPFKDSGKLDCGSSTSGTAGSAGSAGADAGASPDDSSSGCSCSFGERGRAPAGLVCAAGLVGLLLARRRRRAA